MLKKNLLLGLVILLPIAITILIVHVVFDLLTSPFIEFVRPIVARMHLDHNFLFFSSEQITTVISQITILIMLVLLIFILGLFTRWYASRLLIRFTDFVLLHIPIVSTLYKTAQDLIKLLLGTQASAFQKVVLVPFPREGIYSIGFITKDTIHPCSHIVQEDLISVLVPTTPNPTSGFLMLFKKEQIIAIDMPVKDAVKFILSCGVIHSSDVSSKQQDRI